MAATQDLVRHLAAPAPPATLATPSGPLSPAHTTAPAQRTRDPQPHLLRHSAAGLTTSIGHAYNEGTVLVVKRAVDVADDADSAPPSPWCTRHTRHPSEPVQYHEADEPVHQRRRPSCPAGTMGFMFTCFFLRYIRTYLANAITSTAV